jgi:hypothetical protein
MIKGTNLKRERKKIESVKRTKGKTKTLMQQDETKSINEAIQKENSNQRILQTLERDSNEHESAQLKARDVDQLDTLRNKRLNTSKRINYEKDQTSINESIQNAGEVSHNEQRDLKNKIAKTVGVDSTVSVTRPDKTETTSKYEKTIKSFLDDSDSKKSGFITRSNNPSKSYEVLSSTESSLINSPSDPIMERVSKVNDIISETEQLSKEEKKRSFDKVYVKEKFSKGKFSDFDSLLNVEKVNRSFDEIKSLRKLKKDYWKQNLEKKMEKEEIVSFKRKNNKLIKRENLEENDVDRFYKVFGKNNEYDKLKRQEKWKTKNEEYMKNIETKTLEYESHKEKKQKKKGKKDKRSKMKRKQSKLKKKMKKKKGEQVKLQRTG